MPLSDIRAYVTRLSPTQFDTATANSLVNDAYRQVVRKRPWKWLEKEFPLFSVAPYNTGTVAVNNGSATVTGSGTTFTAAMVGKYLQIGSRQPIRITAYSSATSLTLITAWGEANLTGQKYQIIQTRFQMPTDFERVIRLVGPQWPLQRRDLQVIDAIDVYRNVAGPPLIWCEVENVGAAQKEIEIWPVPGSADTYTLTYRLDVPLLVGDSDVAYLSEDVIAALAQSMACRLLAGRTGEQMWLVLDKVYQQEYQQGVEMLARDDRQMKGAHPVVFDSDDSIGDYTDPAFAQWYRTWQQFSMGRVA